MLLLVAVCTGAQALTINEKVYFSYAQGPSGVVALSREPCPVKKYVKDGLKRARFYQRWDMPRMLDPDGVDMCWVIDKQFGTVKICYINKDPHELMGCYPAGKDDFFETSRLPAGVKF